MKQVLLVLSLACVMACGDTVMAEPEQQPRIGPTSYEYEDRCAKVAKVVNSDIYRCDVSESVECYVIGDLTGSRLSCVVIPPQLKAPRDYGDDSSSDD